MVVIQCDINNIILCNVCFRSSKLIDMLQNNNYVLTLNWPIHTMNLLKQIECEFYREKYQL